MNKTVLFELGKCEKVKYQNFAKWLSNCEVDITSDKYCCILSNKKYEYDQYMGISADFQCNIKIPVLIMGETKRQLEYLKKLYISVQNFFEESENANLSDMSAIEKRKVKDQNWDLPESLEWVKKYYLFGLKVFEINTAESGWIVRDTGEDEVILDDVNTPKYLLVAWDRRPSYRHVQWISIKESSNPSVDFLVEDVKKVEKIRSERKSEEQ